MPGLEDFDVFDVHYVFGRVHLSSYIRTRHCQPRVEATAGFASEVQIGDWYMGAMIRTKRCGRKPQCSGMWRTQCMCSISKIRVLITVQERYPLSNYFFCTAGTLASFSVGSGSLFGIGSFMISCSVLVRSTFRLQWFVAYHFVDQHCKRAPYPQ